MTSDTKHRALPLSELIKRIGDGHVECHPLFDCMSNIRVVKGGGNKITLNIVTDKITPGDVACREAKYTGFVILFPIDKCLDARESWDNEEPSTTRDRFTGDATEGQG